MSDFGKALEDKALRFSVRIHSLSRFLNSEKREYRLADQVFRSGTSIGANIAESQCAISRNDFRAKLYIALKECYETMYWLKLLKETSLLTQEQFNSMFVDCEELFKLLTSITKSTRAKDEKMANAEISISKLEAQDQIISNS